MLTLRAARCGPGHLGCFAARQGWMAAEGIAKSMQAMPLMLQRCSQFNWVRP